MTNYREPLRPQNLGLNKTEIAAGCRCVPNTTVATLQRVAICNGLFQKRCQARGYPSPYSPACASKLVGRISDYAYSYRELQ